MVFIYDDGVFDAPIDRVWKYIQNPEQHRHESILSQRVLEEKGNTVKLRVETLGPRGKEEQTWRMTLNPPFGLMNEVLEGSTKGSKNAHTYVPMGDKTKVIVAGDFHVAGMDDAATTKAMLDYLAKVFDEDNKALKHAK